MSSDPRHERLPIVHDDFSFHDRQQKTFEEMRKKMEADMNRPFRGANFDDHFDSMCNDFFHLRPSDRNLTRVRKSEDGGGAPAAGGAIDERSLIVDDPVTKTQKFQISFDVKEYNPNEVTVKVQDGQLIVEARHEEVTEGGASKSTEFSRKIHLPAEVDSSKLSSTLSNDRILTIQAPVPPKYQSVTNGGRSSPSTAGRPLHTPPSFDSVEGRSSPRVYSSATTFMPSPHSPATIGVTRSASPLTRTPPAGGIPVKVDLAQPQLEEPAYFNTDQGCEMQLLVDIGHTYTPEDLVVRVDGRTLIVKAEHEDKQQSKSTKVSMNKEFHLKEDLNPKTINANLKDGRLKITALVQQ